MQDSGHQAGERGGALRCVVGFAAVVVTFAGLKAATNVLLPVLFAIYLTLAVLPIVGWLRNHGVPKPVAIGLVVAGLGSALFAVTGFFAQAVRTFSNGITRYEEPFNAVVRELLA